ncbi:MAG: MarR family winged helix-turn-helix transcriptional regulator [Ktedonobacteraceae bacterium]
MSRDQREREELLAALERAGRDYSGRSVLFHQAIADWLGLNVTDLKCLDLTREADEITPGKLAELSGLTTGAITGVVDRLEKAGYVRRERDPHDRRKVIIQPIPERILPKLSPIFTSLQQAMGAEFGSLYNNQDMALILDFIERSMQVLQAETAKLQARMVQEEVVAQASVDR